MRRKLTVTEAVRNFSDVLGRVRFKGERCILLKGGKPMAELVPTKAASEVRLGDLPAILEPLPHLDPEDAHRFAEDLKAARAAVGRALTAPWDS
jgi:antitoxin (DNA-binding transcriptional repressor) of toxin-antitoxin stability system